MSIPSFMGTHMAVSDMGATLDFYRRIGLPVADANGDSPHVELDLGGGAHLALSTPAVVGMYDPAWRGHSPSTAVVLQFGLDSRDAVDDLYETLTAAGYEGHLAPFDAFWGSRYCEVDDPDGHAVGFHSPRESDAAIDRPARHWGPGATRGCGGSTVETRPRGLRSTRRPAPHILRQP